eukprot:349702-Chlamydomonas_euryale.AAC.5
MLPCNPAYRSCSVHTTNGRPLLRRSHGCPYRDTCGVSSVGQEPRDVAASCKRSRSRSFAPFTHRRLKPRHQAADAVKALGTFSMLLSKRSVAAAPAARRAAPRALRVAAPVGKPIIRMAMHGQGSVGNLGSSSAVACRATPAQYQPPSSAASCSELQSLMRFSEVVPDAAPSSATGVGAATAAIASVGALRSIVSSEAAGMKPYQVSASARRRPHHRQETCAAERPAGACVPEGNERSTEGGRSRTDARDVAARGLRCLRHPDRPDTAEWLERTLGRSLCAPSNASDTSQVTAAGHPQTRARITCERHARGSPAKAMAAAAAPLR